MSKASSTSSQVKPRPGPAPLEIRRAQMRAAARVFRAKQEQKGLFQSVFWMTVTQAREVREWLHKGGDVGVFQGSRQAGGDV